MAQRTHYLADGPVHYTWDESHEPILEVESGDVIVVQTRDVSDGQVGPDSTADVIEGMNWEHVYPLNGPISVKNAHPGDVLAVEVLDLHTRGWGWTWIYPGLGLLPDDFKSPYLRVFEFASGSELHFRDDIVVPVDPFLGTMGVCPAGADAVNIMPPSRCGGNMDIRQLTRGTTLYLPVEVEGALFSCGDGHAAQGDGEVCVSAVEAPLYATLRLTTQRGKSIAAPEFETPYARQLPRDGSGFYATTGVGPDLYGAAQDAVRAMIRHLGDRCGLSREDAYMLASVTVDLKISEIVDGGQYIVSAFLPLGIFRSAER